MYHHNGYCTTEYHEIIVQTDPNTQPPMTFAEGNPTDGAEFGTGLCQNARTPLFTELLPVRNAPLALQCLQPIRRNTFEIERRESCLQAWEHRENLEIHFTPITPQSRIIAIKNREMQLGHMWIATRTISSKFTMIRWRIGNECNTRDRARRVGTKDSTAIGPVRVVVAVPAGPLTGRR